MHKIFALSGHVIIAYFIFKGAEQIDDYFNVNQLITSVLTRINPDLIPVYNKIKEGAEGLAHQTYQFVEEKYLGKIESIYGLFQDFFSGLPDLAEEIFQDLGKYLMNFILKIGSWTNSLDFVWDKIGKPLSRFIYSEQLDWN